MTHDADVPECVDDAPLLAARARNKESRVTSQKKKAEDNVDGCTRRVSTSCGAVEERGHMAALAVCSVNFVLWREGDKRSDR